LLEEIKAFAALEFINLVQKEALQQIMPTTARRARPDTPDTLMKKMRNINLAPSEKKT